MSAISAWLDADIASVEDAEARALLASLRGLPPAAWPAEADPAKIEVLAVRNRVAAELRKRIEAAGKAAPAWAAALRPALEARAISHGSSNRMKSEAVRAVGGAFAERGLEAVALKGFHYAYGVYADPADRPFGDVDLLVRRGEMPAAEDAFMALGFSRGRVETGVGAMEKSFLRELRPGLVLDVDLHWSLMSQLSLVREMRMDEEGTIARSSPAFPGIRFPSREDALVLAAVNLLRHGFRPLGNILDFRELIRGAEPATLVARAHATRTVAALSTALALCEVLFSVEMPEELARALVLPRWQRALFRRLLKPGKLAWTELDHEPTTRYAMKILSQDGVKGVARTLAGLPGVVVNRWAGR